MICPNCAAENVAGAKFCNECGTALATGCPNCGAINKPGAKFCNECGTALGAQQTSTASDGQQAGAAAAAERRHVTVLFADIVGFTPFAEARDAEDVRDTLSGYFDLCSQVVERYGGTIEKYIGDAVMAVWGAPVAHEDDAERAVRAALELVSAVPGLASGVEARAGVLTGEAAVTIGAINQGLVAGDLVNTAARLQSVAQPSSVLVGESTMLASSNAIAYEPAGEQALKGKQAPVPAWRAVRVVAERGGRNRSETLEAPFVGRADELRLLKDLFHATGREQKVRLVSVIGPAGIGKSRLAWEFLKYVDGLVETTYWHDGRSPAYGEGISFWALGEMIRGRAGLLEGDDEATTRAKIAETVAQWVSDEQERTWIESSLLTLLGVESGASSAELFTAWRTFFERIAEHATVTLVFEDVHFADTGLLDFIEHMLDWSRGRAIYIVTLSRPELLDRRPDWGAGKRSFTSIYLEPLADGEMRELLSGLVPGLPDQVVQQIVDRADGIPLYAVETVRMLLSEGRIVEHAGAYVPAGDLGSLAVPETLTALIRSRLDALDADERAVIHDASVVGQSFSLASLAAVSGRSEAQLETMLEQLVRRELLTHDVDPRSPERGQYAFVQALIREVAYNTLSKRDRKVRHLAAARYFEQLGGDELAGALASHYLAAWSSASEPAEADALAAQARVALRGAAERAVRLGAHMQAVTFLQQAITVTSDPAMEAELLETASVSAGLASKASLAVDLARQAVELRETLDDRLAIASSIANLGSQLLDARSDSDARSVLEDGLARFGDLWPEIPVVRVKAYLARAVGQFNDSARAVELADEALEIAEHSNEPRLLAEALVGKGFFQGSRGRLREGIALMAAAEEVARQHDVTDMIVAALTTRGYMLGEVDNAAAMRCFREALEISRRTGQVWGTRQMINNICYTGFLTGEWDEVLPQTDEVLEEEMETAERVWLLSNELIIRISRGDDVSAAMAELADLASKVSDPHISAAPMDPLANLAQAEGRLDDARNYFMKIGEMNRAQIPASNYQAARAALWSRDIEAVKSSLAAIDASGYHGDVVETRRATLRAGIAGLEGREREAIAGYEEAIKSWRTVGMVWEEALTGLDMVTILDPTDPAVAAVARDTRAIFERLGARPYLAHLDRALENHAARKPAARAREETRAAAPSA